MYLDLVINPCAFSLFIYLFVYLFIYLIYLSIYLFVCLFIYLFVLTLTHCMISCTVARHGRIDVGEWSLTVGKMFGFCMVEFQKHF